MYRSKWFYTIAGGGVVLSLFSYLNIEKKKVTTSWNSDFSPETKWDHNWDKREPSSLVRPSRKNKASETEDNRINEEIQKVTPTASRNLIFIRHGQYNQSGTSDDLRTLTTLGREQAELTGQRLKVFNHKFDKIVQSTMTRALETSSIIQKHLPEVAVESCSMLREGAPISTEPPIGKWKPAAWFHTDGARIEAAFRRYFHRADASQKKNSFELYVCHANVIRYFICRALQFPPEAWMRFTLHNCSITWFCIRPNGRVFIYSVGDTGHLSPDKLSIL